MTRTEKFAWLLAALILGISLYVQYVSGNAGDRNWLLLAGRMWLGGKKLYRDIFEVNPPLIVWIYGGVVWLSGLSRILLDYQMLMLVTIAEVALVIAVCVRIAAYHPAFKGDTKKQAQLALLLAYTLIVWTSPVFFGDREHIFFTLTLPYMFRSMPSLSDARLSRKLRVLIGVMAGVGFCIKPQTVFVFAVAQLLVMRQERSLRVLIRLENLLIYALGALYLTLVFLYTPEYLRIVLPMALETYTGYGTKLQGMNYIVTGCFILAVTFIDFRPRHNTPYRPDIYYFLALCAGYLLYALTNNGWAYTYNPLICMLLILNGWVLWEFAYLKREHLRRGQPDKQFGFGMRDCMLNMALSTVMMLVIYSQALTSSCTDNAICKLHERFSTVIREDTAGSFGTITTTYVFWPHLTRATGAEWNTRFNHLWMMPVFFSADETFIQAHHWVLEYVANALAEDLNIHKPEVVFVDNNQTFDGGRKHIDLAQYFSAFDAFKSAWTHYRFEQTIASCPHPEKIACNFDVYRHIP